VPVDKARPDGREKLPDTLGSIFLCIQNLGTKVDQLTQEQMHLRVEVAAVIQHALHVGASGTLSGHASQYRAKRSHTPTQNTRSLRQIHEHTRSHGIPSHAPMASQLRAQASQDFGDGVSSQPAVGNYLSIAGQTEIHSVHGSQWGSSQDPRQFASGPIQWPTGIAIRKELEAAANGETMSSVSSLIARQTFDDSMEERASRKKRADYSCGPCDPDNLFMTLFDVLTSVVLVHDLILTPYVAVFDEDGAGVMGRMALTAACFWSLDFCLGFYTGFYFKGELNTDVHAIVWNYATGWCIPNLAILVFDWTSILTTTTNDTRILKMLRLVKVFRLMRLMRLVDKVSVWCALSRRGRTALQVLKLIAGVLIYNHFVSCVWLFIGIHAVTDTGFHWLDYQVGGQSTLVDMSDRYKYVTALHWTIAQMTPGPIDIVAVNSIEQVFNNVILVCGLFFGSLIVSLCSGTIMQLVIAQRDATMKMEALEKLLRVNAVHPRLALRVKRQVMEKMSEATHVSEDSVKALQDLSGHLRLQLMCATRKPHLLSHPLFRIWEEVDPHAFSVLCGDSVMFDYLTMEDELFVVSDDAPFAYYVIVGSLVYRQWTETSKVDVDQEAVVLAETWLCEAVLWSHWAHVGDMMATSAVHLLTIEAERFVKVCNKKTAVSEIAKQYGRQFHLRIISAVPPHAPWPSDVEVPFTQGAYANDLITHEVGLGLYNRAKSELRCKLTEELLRGLEHELRQEKCTLQVDPQGQLERVVAVVTIKIFHEDGTFLTQIGRWTTNGGVKVQCELPGTKRCLSEPPQLALQKILDKELGPLKDYIEIRDTLHETLTKESPKYGMNTRYIRTVHQAILLPSCQWENALILYGRPEKDVNGSDAYEVVSDEPRISSDAPIGRNAVYILNQDKSPRLYAFVTEDEFTSVEESSNDKVKKWLTKMFAHVDEADMADKRWLGDC